MHLHYRDVPKWFWVELASLLLLKIIFRGWMVYTVLCDNNMTFHLSNAWFHYVQKLKSDFKSWLQCLIREKMIRMDDRKIIDLEGGCLASISITKWHFREAIHTSPGHKCLAFQADWLWIKRGGAIRQVVSAPPSAFTLVLQDPAPLFFFK